MRWALRLFFAKNGPAGSSKRVLSKTGLNHQGETGQPAIRAWRYPADPKGVPRSPPAGPFPPKWGMTSGLWMPSVGGHARRVPRFLRQGGPRASWPCILRPPFRRRSRSRLGGPLRARFFWGCQAGARARRSGQALDRRMPWNRAENAAFLHDLGLDLAGPRRYIRCTFRQAVSFLPIGSGGQRPDA